MLIRSQNKKILTNIGQVTDLGVKKFGEGFGIKAYYPFAIDEDYSGEVIGEYSTEEKAIKVLDMIQQAYCKSFEEKKDNYVGHRYNLVFQMPEDEEVKE